MDSAVAAVCLLIHFDRSSFCILPASLFLFICHTHLPNATLYSFAIRIYQMLLLSFHLYRVALCLQFLTTMNNGI